jgi:hypothetical protein
MAENTRLLQAICRPARNAVGWLRECGWGVWCNQPTDFAACPHILPRRDPNYNLKMLNLVKYSLKLKDIF